MYSDVLEQAGVISVNSLAEALAAVEVLAFLQNPRLGGDPKAGISVLSSSGGAGALLADHSSEFNIPMSEFSPETAERLEQILPEFARKANPVDLTGQIYSDPEPVQQHLSCARRRSQNRGHRRAVRQQRRPQPSG